MTQTSRYAETSLPRGIESIFDICDDLRERNSDGWVAKVGGHLARIQGDKLSLSTATTCSPFTATVIAVAFDKGPYPRKDWPDWPKPPSESDPYTPMFDGGSKPLPFMEFYKRHNDADAPVQSIAEYNLGYEIPRKELWRIRRGDLIAIDWYPEKKWIDPKDGLEKTKLSGGHVVFCWDVHTDANGHTDCIQLIGSNGSPPAGYGVSIVGCYGPKWIGGSLSSGKLGSGSLKKNPERLKNGKFFVHDDAVVQAGKWYGLPGVKREDIDTSTFKVPVPKGNLVISDPSHHSLGYVRAARFHYQGDPPKPYCMREGAAPAKPPDKIGHADAPVVVLRGPDVKKDPEKPKTVAPKPAPQDQHKPLALQHYVEDAMREFHLAKWIKADPGKSEDINDASSQAAIKEFQTLFKLKVDGIVGPKTLTAIDRHLPAALLMVTSQLLLGILHRGKKLTHDPGLPDGVNNDGMRAAVQEFQQANGLAVTGVPDGDTLEKIIEVCQGHAATAEKPGLSPEIHHLYWVRNNVEVGGSAALRLHSRDLILGQECPVHLEDEASGKKVEAAVKLKVGAAESEASIPIPAEFGAGARLKARVVASLAGEGELEATTGETLHVLGKAAGALAVIEGDDVYLDPPVRLLPQYDPRWGESPIGRLKSGKLVPWRPNGCNASSAAMILRWFAEDCGAGKIPFPTKPGGRVDTAFYSPRMGEALWPSLDPPGQVEMSNDRIYFRKVFAVAAHYLKSGEIARDGSGDAAEPSSPKSHYVTQKPKAGWLDLLRRMLKTGPVIFGMGPPTSSGHFVVAHGLVGGMLYIADPGCVLYSAHRGGKSPWIADWKGKGGYLDGTMDRAKVRMPSASQWPGGHAPGLELDARSYYAISGEFLDSLLDGLISLTSLTYPEGPRLESGAA